MRALWRLTSYVVACGLGKLSGALQGTEPRQAQPGAARAVGASRRDMLAAALLLAATCTGAWRPWPAQVARVLQRCELGHKPQCQRDLLPNRLARVAIWHSWLDSSLWQVPMRCRLASSSLHRRGEHMCATPRIAQTLLRAAFCPTGDRGAQEARVGPVHKEEGQGAVGDVRAGGAPGARPDAEGRRRHGCVLLAPPTEREYRPNLLGAFLLCGCSWLGPGCQHVAEYCMRLFVARYLLSVKSFRRDCMNA